MEYLFCDTGAELVETYDYLGRVESYLEHKIVRLNNGKMFEEFLNKHRQQVQELREQRLKNSDAADQLIEWVSTHARFPTEFLALDKSR